jgi:hypothetical protein
MLAFLLAACHGGDSDTDPLVAPDDTTPVVVSSEACDACGGDCVDEVLLYAKRYHWVGPIDYAVVPPAGGPHNECWTDWGVHDEPVPDDNWVHNLEHGGVALLWNCPDGCDVDAATIDALVPNLGEFALSTPYGPMDPQFAAVSWEHRLLLGWGGGGARSAVFVANAHHPPHTTGTPPPSGSMPD